MDKELIERLAKEAGLERRLWCGFDLGGERHYSGWMGAEESLAKFAHLVAEACAIEAMAAFQPASDFKGTNLYFERCARVVRAKFPPPI